VKVWWWLAMAACTDAKDNPCAAGFVAVGERCEPVAEPSLGDSGQPGPTDSGFTPDTGEPPVAENAVLESGDEVTCADATQRLSRPYRTVQRLEGETIDLSPWDPIAAAGFAVADFDTNGSLDLYLPQLEGDQLYMNVLESGATDSAPTRVPATVGGGSAGAIAVDIDGDGDTDVFVPKADQDHRFLINDGAGMFSDETEAMGLAEQGWPAVGAVFADGDGDGDLDMLVNTYRSCDDSMGPLPENPYTDGPQALWEHTADGTFNDVSTRIPDHPAGRSRLRAALWMDADRDGDPDVYTVSDRGYISECMVNNQFFRNTEGEYVDESDATSLGLQMEGMGIGYGDINGDGWPDLAMSDMQRAWLMESDGAGGWYDATFTRGLTLESSSDDRWSGWGTEMADVDNDGDLDLFMAFGGLPDAPGGSMNPWLQPDQLWLQQSDGTFEPVADDWGIANTASTRAAHLTDLNGDGWLDLITREIAGQVSIHLANCGEARWIRVALTAPDKNRDALGARVDVITEEGTQTRWVTQGTRGLQSSVPPTVHFGLGNTATIDLRVTWVDGETSLFRNVPTNRNHRIERIP